MFILNISDIQKLKNNRKRIYLQQLNIIFTTKKERKKKKRKDEETKRNKQFYRMLISLCTFRKAALDINSFKCKKCQNGTNDHNRIFSGNCAHTICYPINFQ